MPFLFPLGGIMLGKLVMLAIYYPEPMPASAAKSKFSSENTPQALIS